MPRLTAQKKRGLIEKLGLAKPLGCFIPTGGNFVACWFSASISHLELHLVGFRVHDRLKESAKLIDSVIEVVEFESYEYARISKEQGGAAL